MKPPRILIVLLVGALLGTSCSKQATRAERPASSSSTVAPACPGGVGRSLPANARRISRKAGDMDGDGRSDELIAYAAVDEDEAITGWRIRVLLATNQGIDSSLQKPEQTFPGDIQAYGLADANGDGKAEGFVLVNAGVSVIFLGALTVSGCQIDWIHIAHDGRVLLGASGSFGSGFSFDCEHSDSSGRRLLVVREIVLDVNSYRWKESSYRWLGSTLVPAGTRKGTLPSTAAVSARAPFYGIHCGNLPQP